MNICFICREYPPAPRTGGIGSATRDTAHALVRLAHRVHVVAPAWEEPGTFSDAGVAVHRVRLPRWPRGEISRFAGHTLDRLVWSWAAARAVARLDRSEGIDVVEAPEFAAEAVVATRRASPPVVVRLHTPLALVRVLNGLVPTADCRRTVALERAAIGAAAAVTAPSQALAAAGAEAGYGPRAAVARIIPYGVDAEVFRPEGAAARDASSLVLFPGRLETRKGVGDLADALPVIAGAVPEARFAFVGADTTTAPGGVSWLGVIRAGARAAGIDDRVRFAGFVPRERMPAWYGVADVVVAPSRFEPFGIVYLEAMACGRPVVGCAAGAFPEIATDGRDGVVVPPGDAHAIAKAVIRLLEQPEDALEIGARARRRVVEGFSIETIARSTADFYESVARQGRKA